MKKFSKILVFSVLAVFLMVGSAWAVPVYTSASNIGNVFTSWELKHSDGTPYDMILDQSGEEWFTPNANLAPTLKLKFEENFGTNDIFGIYNALGTKVQIFPGSAGYDDAVLANFRDLSGTQGGDSNIMDLELLGGSGNVYIDFGVEFGYYFESTYLGAPETVYSESWRNDGIKGSNHIDETFMLAYAGEVGASMTFDDGVNYGEFGNGDWIIAGDWYDHGVNDNGTPSNYTDDYFNKDFDDYVVYVSETNPVPEPATMLLLGSGLIGLAGLGRRKFFKKG